MASKGSQGFVQRRGGSQPSRNRVVDESPSEREIFRLNPEDYDKIVSYLEIPENFAAIVGGGRKTTVGKKYGSKATVFKSMLAAIQHHGFPMQINSANVQKRFECYVKRYKDAREFKLDSGGGLTEDEVVAGVLLNDKLERLCPNFERMHTLYGERPNVAPVVLGDAGVDDDELIGAVDMDKNGDLSDDSEAENVNPNTPTPNSPRDNHEEMGNNSRRDGMAPHSSSCQCMECRNFPGLSTGETCPVPTESLHDTEPPTPARSISTNHPTTGPTPAKKATKTPAQAAKEVLANSKPSFMSIYADRISQKADYRKDLITSRDKRKAEDLAEQRAARLETQAKEELQERLARKDQLRLETVAAEHARKKARQEFEHVVEISISKIKAEQLHEQEMAHAARKTALLTTLFGSSKSPAEIKDLLPIIDDTE